MVKHFLQKQLLIYFALLLFITINSNNIQGAPPFTKPTSHQANIKKQTALYQALLSKLQRSWDTTTVTITKQLWEKPQSIPTNKRGRRVPDYPPPTSNNKNEEINLFFWSEKVEVPQLNKYIAALAGKDCSVATNKSAIIKQFNTLYKTEWDVLQPKLIDFAHRLNLSDWGYCLFINKIGEEIYEDNNAKNLFVWFMLYCSNISCELVTYEESIYLAFPCKQEIYTVPKTRNNFYVYDFSLKKAPIPNMATIQQTNLKKEWNTDAETIQATGVINLYYDLPNINNKKTATFTFEFTYGGKSHTINSKIQTNLLAYFNKFPVTELPIYFETTLKSGTKYYPNLLRQLQDIVTVYQKPEDQLNCLLAFTQSLDYKKDKRPYFPLQTLTLGYSDCEDRAMLFANLAYELLGMTTVGLEYGKKHVAIGIDLDCVPELQQEKLTKVRKDDKQYIICDPTYLNYQIGEINKNYVDIQPTIIQLFSKKGIGYD